MCTTNAAPLFKMASATLDVYHQKQCTGYRLRIQEALRDIHHLSQTKHITSMICLLLSTTHWRWKNKKNVSSSEVLEVSEVSEVDSAYEDIFLYRRLLSEMYSLSFDSAKAQDAYLDEWHRFLRLARNVLVRMEQGLNNVEDVDVDVEDIDDVEEIENVS